MIHPDEIRGADIEPSADDLEAARNEFLDDNESVIYERACEIAEQRMQDEADEAEAESRADDRDEYGDGP